MTVIGIHLRLLPYSQHAINKSCPFEIDLVASDPNYFHIVLHLPHQHERRARCHQLQSPPFLAPFALCVIFLGFAALAGLLYLPFRRDPAETSNAHSAMQARARNTQQQRCMYGCVEQQLAASARARFSSSLAFVDILSFIQR